MTHNGQKGKKIHTPGIDVIGLDYIAQDLDRLVLHAGKGRMQRLVQLAQHQTNQKVLIEVVVGLDDKPLGLAKCPSERVVKEQRQIEGREVLVAAQDPQHVQLERVEPMMVNHVKNGQI